MDSYKNVSNYNRLEQFIQYYLDRVTPYVTARWLANLVLLILFSLRLFVVQGFYIVAYALGIFLLNHLILFLTPKQDFGFSTDDDDDYSARLPRRSTDEFRPFMRHLAEFKFWYLTFKALVISLILTLFPILNIPVFWPILLIYFLVLTFFTMRQRISHMIRYRYIPFTYGKVRYARKNQGPRVSTN